MFKLFALSALALAVGCAAAPAEPTDDQAGTRPTAEEAAQEALERHTDPNRGGELPLIDAPADQDRRNPAPLEPPGETLNARRGEAAPRGAGHPAPAAAPRIAWRTDWNAAVAESAASGRPLYLYWTTDGCAPCARVEANVHGNPAFAAAINAQAVPVKLNARRAENAAHARRLGVSSFPYVVAARPRGDALERYQGPAAATPAAELRRLETWRRRLFPESVLAPALR